ncbi:hypothetical protein FOCC_FOCC009556 [Frankliniella occidentalis]|nr:hypothetical protein FOCC_FOCC009556 [Frankliniella occidentalis]
MNGGAPTGALAQAASLLLELLLLHVCLAGVARAAPFPAHLVVHAGHRPHGHAPWQEYPVALHPINNNSANFRPILPGTDHGLYNKGFFEGDILRKDATSKEDPDTKNAVSDPNLLWPHATVVYKVDDDVAMDHYHEHSCIRFKQWTGEDNWVSIFFNSDSSGACWSPVGKQGDGEQRLSLGQRCWYKGIVIHELGHAIGFWHEMNRPDRDDWIYVYWQNIIPGFASAFRKHTAVNTLNERFDYNSIMMSFDTAGTTPGHFMSINFPPISSALSSVRGELGCVRFYYLIETDGEAQLVLDQAYLKKSTQLNHDAATTFQLWSNNTSTNEWIHMEIPLFVTRSFKLIFTSNFNGSATHGTIALDDVELLYTPCNPVQANVTATTPEPAMAAPKPKPLHTTTAAPTTTTTTTTTTAAPTTTTTTPLPTTPMPATDMPTTTDSTEVPTEAPVTSADTTSSSAATEAPPSSSSSGTTSGLCPLSPPPPLSVAQCSELAISGPTAPPTSTPAMLTTAEVEEALQQQQLQQQQSILEAQQLLEKQQKKEQQEQLAAMANSLQQHVAMHSHAHKKKIPNLPVPTDRIPLKNPNATSHDTDESRTVTR